MIFCLFPLIPIFVTLLQDQQRDMKNNFFCFSLKLIIHSSNLSLKLMRWPGNLSETGKYH